MFRKYFQVLKNRVLAIIIIITLFYISLVIFSDTPEMMRNLISVQASYIIVILLFFSSAILLRSIRQVVLLRQVNINIPYKKSLIIYCAGLLMTITPAGIGQMIKSGYIYKLTHDRIAKTLPLVIAERYYDALALSCFVAVLVFVLRISALIVPITIFIIGLTVFTVIVKQKSIQQSLTSLLIRIKIFRISKDDMAEFNQSLDTYFRKESFFCPWLVSIAVAIFDALGIYTCFIALNMDINIGLTTAIGFTSILFGAATFIPGGVGVTEISFIKFLSDNGITIAAATAVVILVRLCSVWYSTFIGAIATYFASKLRYEPDLKA